MQVFIRMTTKRDKPGWDILHQYNAIDIASDWAVYTVQTVLSSRTLGLYNVKLIV